MSATRVPLATAGLVILAVLRADLTAYTVRAFMGRYDRRWTAVTALHRSRSIEVWTAVRTPLAEPALEWQRQRVVRQFVFSAALAGILVGDVVLSLYFGVLL